ncbi:MAG: molybdenum cofactor guanylyltransferase [Saprospiraceae bacterium]|nr:molybdenum cofactor guanylyltransferase [Saprospiraceae bacterium]
MRLPRLCGLVLAGGKSRRLGEDKSFLDFHGKPQYAHAADLLSRECAQVLISVRQDQDLPASYTLLPDDDPGLGPFGAILTALSAHPDSAWLVLAVDLPLFDLEALRVLVAHRNPDKIVTAFVHNEWPEPLAAIWEPAALQKLRTFKTAGNYSPTDLLRQADIETVVPARTEWLLNVNRPEDLDQVRAILQARG